MNDPSSAAVEIAIEKLRTELPESVKRLHYELGFEAEGEPAVWLWVVFKDADIETQWTLENRTEIRQQATQLFRETGIPHWVYVRFRSESEDKQLPASNNIVTV
ncbi:MAG: hypothetical protein VKJ64_17565 [Leptolyngbyaceae bacterium]|nr:hypothetical protein [Leptolyngbyaceae bacterium]